MLGFVGFVGLLGFVEFVGFIGFVGLVGLVGFVGLALFRVAKETILTAEPLRTQRRGIFSCGDDGSAISQG